MSTNQTLVGTVVPDVIRPPAMGASPDVGGSNCNIVINRDNIRLSKRRWLILFAMWFFGFAYTLSSELSPILHVMTTLLDIDVDEYIYIGQISFYLLIITAMPTAWFVDKYGIRASMYLSVLLMLFRNTLMTFLFYPSSPYWRELRMYYYVISSIIGMIAFTLFFCLPLKVSELWFSTSERSVAWTIMFSALNLGVSLGAAIYPRFIHEDLKTINYLSYLQVGSFLVSAPIVLLGVTKSEPKYPPSERMIKSIRDKSPYLVTIRKMLKSRDIIIHTMHNAIFEGLSLAISSLMQDLFIRVNKTPVFIGDLIAFNSIASLVSIILLASLVHRAKNITFVCKLASLTQALALVLYMVSMKYELPDWQVLLVSFIYTISRSWYMPNSTNMTAHLSSGIVSQATIVGFNMIFVTVITNIIQTLFVTISTKVGPKSTDYTNSLIFAAVLSLLTTTFYALFFSGRAAGDDGEENNQSTREGSA